jgi:hypothetical protein
MLRLGLSLACLAREIPRLTFVRCVPADQVVRRRQNPLTPRDCDGRPEVAGGYPPKLGDVEAMARYYPASLPPSRLLCVALDPRPERERAVHALQGRQSHSRATHGAAQIHAQANLMRDKAAPLNSVPHPGDNWKRFQNTEPLLLEVLRL